MNAGKILCNDHLYLTFRNSSKLSAPNVKDAKSKKSSFVIVPLHRVRRENRFMYGPINKKEKQILEKSTDTSRNNSSLKDPELWWHLKLSKSTMKPLHTGKQFTVIKVKNLKTYDKIEKADRVSKDTVKKAIVNTEDNIKINSVTYKNIEAVEKTCDKQDRVSAINDNKRDDAIKTTDNTNKSEIPALKESQLFNMVINNMALFPIINPKKELPLMADKMDILSISGKDEPDTQHYPTVTKILSATLSPESKKLLEMWKARLIAEMGEDKFKEYYQEQLNSGVLFHSYIENTLYGKSAEVSESLQLAVDSLSNVLKELEAVKAIESHVSHKHLQYKGKMDCVAMYRGELCVIDWKKSTKTKSSLAATYDAPVQIAAYIGALNYSKKYPFTVNTGLIVVAYTNGQEADTYLVKDNTLKSYWKKWLMKLQQYWSSFSIKN